MVVCIAITTFLLSCSSSQKINNSPEAEKIRAAIDTNWWSFKALHMQPQVGRAQMVNGLYTADYAGNKINSYLPYIGRAFSGYDVYSSTKSVLDFVSSNFTVEKEQVSANKWVIVVKPQDQKEIQTMTYTLFANGSASLSVTLTNRSPISFTGTVAPLKNK